MRSKRRVALTCISSDEETDDDDDDDETEDEDNEDNGEEVEEGDRGPSAKGFQGPVDGCAAERLLSSEPRRRNAK